MKILFGFYFGLSCVLGTVFSSDKDVCNQPIDPGSGTEMIHSFYFSPADKHCLPFYYSGSEGNQNRFADESECMKVCSDRHNDLYPAEGGVCSLPVEVGVCLARIVMFYYNQEEKTCRTFIYGGCGGNGNRFNTKEQCEQTCAKAGRSLGSSPNNPNPDAPSVNIGQVVGIIGGCIFGVAVIAAIALFVVQRKSKTRDRKKVPTSAVEVEMQSP